MPDTLDLSKEDIRELKSFFKVPLLMLPIYFIFISILLVCFYRVLVLHHSWDEVYGVSMVILIVSIFTLAGISTHAKLTLIRKILIDNDHLAIYSRGLLSRQWKRQLLISRKNIDRVQVVRVSETDILKGIEITNYELIFKWTEAGQTKSYRPMWGTHMTSSEELILQLKDLASKAPKFPIDIPPPLTRNMEIGL